MNSLEMDAVYIIKPGDYHLEGAQALRFGKPPESQLKDVTNPPYYLKAEDLRFTRMDVVGTQRDQPQTRPRSLTL